MGFLHFLASVAALAPCGFIGSPWLHVAPGALPLSLLAPFLGFLGFLVILALPVFLGLVH